MVNALSFPTNGCSGCLSFLNPSLKGSFSCRFFARLKGSFSSQLAHRSSPHPDTAAPTLVDHKMQQMEAEADAIATRVFGKCVRCMQIASGEEISDMGWVSQDSVQSFYFQKLEIRLVAWLKPDHTRNMALGCSTPARPHPTLPLPDRPRSSQSTFQSARENAYNVEETVTEQPTAHF